MSQNHPGDDADERISALFRAAASAASPPPAFDHSRVVATSRRITARRRSAVLGTAAALVVVAGVGLGVGLPAATGGGSTAAAPASSPEAAVPDAASEEAPGAAPLDARATPLGPGTAACADRQDPQLRALVDAALPEVAGAGEAATTQECRPGGERGVNLEVSDAGVPGLLVVSYFPPGTIVDPVAGAVVEPTASGGTVLVYARGEQGGGVPFADRIQSLADALAPRL